MTIFKIPISIRYLKLRLVIMNQIYINDQTINRFRGSGSVSIGVYDVPDVHRGDSISGLVTRDDEYDLVEIFTTSLLNHTELDEGRDRRTRKN